MLYTLFHAGKAVLFVSSFSLDMLIHETLMDPFGVLLYWYECCLDFAVKGGNCWGCYEINKYDFFSKLYLVHG